MHTATKPSAASPRKLNNKFLKLHRQLYDLERLCSDAVPSPDGSHDESNRRRDVVARALLALRKATAEQRTEIVRQFGPEAMWAVLSETLEPNRGASNGSASVKQPDLFDGR